MASGGQDVCFAEQYTSTTITVKFKVSTDSRRYPWGYATQVMAPYTTIPPLWLVSTKGSTSMYFDISVLHALSITSHGLRHGMNNFARVAPGSVPRLFSCSIRSLGGGELAWKVM
jgi:hypothetical protein